MFCQNHDISWKLQWALPRLGLRWSGFRKVRRQVCRRVRRRLDELELADLDAYRAHLEAHPEEWALFDSLTPAKPASIARAGDMCCGPSTASS